MATPVILVQDAPTRVQSWQGSLKQNESKTFPGGPLGRHRRQIIITNDDADFKLHIVTNPGTDHKKCNIVFTNDQISLFTNDEISIQAVDGDLMIGTSGQPAIFVQEFFYTGETPP